MSDIFLTTDIDCHEGLAAVGAARKCHKTQWSPEVMAQMQEAARELDGGHVFLRLALSEIPLKPGQRETDISRESNELAPIRRRRKDAR